MPRDRLNFRQRDLAVAVKTLKAAGVPIARVDVDKDGGFKIITCAAAELDDDAIEAGTKFVDERIGNVFEEKGPQQKKRFAAGRLGSAKPPRQR
jgi:hypothetical protein